MLMAVTLAKPVDVCVHERLSSVGPLTSLNIFKARNLAANPVHCFEILNYASAKFQVKPRGYAHQPGKAQYKSMGQSH